MEYTDVDPSFRARFLEAKFDPDVFMQSILNSTSKCIDSSELLNIKSRMHLISSEAEYDLKENVHRTHKKFIETAKQVTALDSEMYQLHSLLSNEKQLISTVKDLLNVDNKSNKSQILEPDFWDTLLRHCQCLGLIETNTDRQLIHHGKLLEVKLENFPTNQYYRIDGVNKSYTTQACYGLLFNDCFVIVKSETIRTATAYDVDQIIKIESSTFTVKDDLIRNSFSIKYNLELVTMICDNAQIKKTWMEMFENILKRNSKIDSTLSNNQFDEEEEWMKNTQENLTILLAERNFDQALILIRKARTYIQQFQSKHGEQSILFAEKYIKNIQEKEQDLSKSIEKEILYICERGCSTNLSKHYYHHIQILKQLGHISKACELFFTIQLSLMKTTLKQTKLEELNVAFVPNFTNIFFRRLVDSYYEFVQIFKDYKPTFTKFIVWMTMEIERLISNLHNKQYIGTKNFTFSMKNIEILLNKADEFSSKLIDVKFIFEEKLEPILIQIIRAQKDMIIDTLRQRHRDEKWTPITFQTHERLEQLYYEFHELGVDSQEFLQPFVYMDDEQDFLQVILAPSTLQFSKAYLTFARLLFKIHYLAINHPIVEALIELIKLHMKYFERTLQKTDEEELKDFIMKNVDFSLNYLFRQVDELYRPKLGNEAKYFKKIYKKFDQLKEIAECKTHF